MGLPPFQTTNSALDLPIDVKKHIMLFFSFSEGGWELKIVNINLCWTVMPLDTEFNQGVVSSRVTMINYTTA